MRTISEPNYYSELVLGVLFNTFCSLKFESFFLKNILRVRNFLNIAKNLMENFLLYFQSNIIEKLNFGLHFSKSLLDNLIFQIFQRSFELILRMNGRLDELIF